MDDIPCPPRIRRAGRVVELLELDSSITTGAGTLRPSDYGGREAVREGAGPCHPVADNRDAAGRPITLSQPRQILFGAGSARQLAAQFGERGLRHVFLVTSPSVLSHCGEWVDSIHEAVPKVTICSAIRPEPTVMAFEDCLARARQAEVDGIVGLGGGSVLDVAKLVAALLRGPQTVHDVFGINLLRARSVFLACVPTTAGTGSEVSPNAILLDEAAGLKKAAISPHLVPDIACVDPLLARSLPPDVTAATGLDALAHCVEAYSNCFAHPAVDLYALEGVRRISRSLLAAVNDGRNEAARTDLALGSLYGGLCLGPVNTAAVHALAYPLGGEFHVGHGVSIAVLLPHVLRFNLAAAPERYAEIAKAMGIAPLGSAQATAERFLEQLGKLIARCPIPQRLGELGVPRDALPRLAKSAMTVTRLLKNNPRPVTEADALEIYSAAY